MLRVPILAAVAALALAVPVAASAADAVSSDDGMGATALQSPRVFLSPYIMTSSFLASLELDGFEEAADDAGFDDPGGDRIPEPNQGRIQARKKRFSTRYRMQERMLGVALQPSFAMLQGSVVSSSFDNGFAMTGRFIAQVSPANQVFFDLGYSVHNMKNPRPMFFRTAVTSDSGFSGHMEVWSPALFVAFTFPIGSSPRSKPMFIPKTYVGLGPMYTFASGKVTRSGAKGTVTGFGRQPFFQFTPGFGLDVRVLDFYFIGFEMRERITLPTKRPKKTAEFSIQKLYVFETALNFSYMFY